MKDLFFVSIVILFCTPVRSYSTNSLYSRIKASKQQFQSTAAYRQAIGDRSRRGFIASSVALVSATSAIQPACPISPERASRDYDIYSETYDNLDGGSPASALGIDEARTKLLGLARGDVLEIGVGTGLNLSSYKLEGIKSLTLVDISEGMLSKAKARVDQLDIEKNIPVKIIQADATTQLVDLFGKNKFDTVVDTFSLCVMGNVGAEMCLQQMTDVVKSSGDGGQVLLIENTRSSNPLLGAYQDITASSAADLGGKGCLYNQDVGKMIQRSEGLMLLREEAYAAGLFRSFICGKST